MLVKRISVSVWILVFLLAVEIAFTPASNSNQDDKLQEPASIVALAKKLRIELLNRPEAPDFSLKDLSGKKVKLTDFRGNVVLMNFWTTW